MPRNGPSHEEIIRALPQVEGGEKVTEVCRRLGVSKQAFYRWKKQFAGLGLSEQRELRSLRHENGKLKQLVADLTLDHHDPAAARPDRERGLVLGPAGVSLNHRDPESQ
jgi:putative transposase